MIRSLEELKEIRDEQRNKIHIRLEDSNLIKILVCMSECAVAAGAKSVLDAFFDEVSKRNLENVIVVEASCIDMCECEPVVEVIIPGDKRVKYIKMTAEKAKKVINDHIINHKVVKEYTIDENS